MVTINRVQNGDYIIDINTLQFCNENEIFTAVYVEMSRCECDYLQGKYNCTRIKLFDKYCNNNKPENVAEIFNDAWKIFMDACKFCQVSPISDGTGNTLGCYIIPRRMAS